ncbi:unconventional prefoldin RPB5 interactor [Elysia marginata]|uniref:Unconventional prefoldin RPB5 interactor n=1 Tax=Elysia marginata TaxID=1093978 RepID=A0AAV4GYC8_9GAST|nr:unconventional prefoldin RPB5 interactor [Elysia marginata]
MAVSCCRVCIVIHFITFSFRLLVLGEKYKNDYETLQERLRTLPNELTHDVMVPFGKLAFMPGKLVHTNEILVLLGDNWFVERSAKQAEDIAQRRIEELNKQLNNLKAQKKLLEPRLEFTSGFKSHMKGKEDVKEIVEEYDAEKERLWDEQHRKNVHKEKEAERMLNKNPPPKPIAAKKQQASDSDLWARLDALEEEEKKRGELESEDSEEEDDDKSGKTLSKGVKQQDQLAKEDGQESDDYSDNDGADDANDGDKETSGNDDTNDEFETDDSEGSEGKRPAVRTIRFTHTDVPSHQCKTAGSAGDTTIDSPADIYKLYCPPSILKKPALGRKKENRKSLPATSKSVGFSSDDDHEMTVKPPSVPSDPPRPKASSSLKAFSGRVLETSQNTQTSGSSPAVHERQADQVTQDELPKRVSKFKASRMAQQGFS